jgi:uncharacterized protein
MIGRRAFVTLAASLPFAARANEELRVHGGAPGGAFLPYAQGLARHLTQSGAGPAHGLESAGSLADLAAVIAGPAALGLVDLSAIEPARAPDLRALFPAFRTTYHFAVARSTRIASFAGLNARRVGVGPEDGAGAALFAEVARGALIFPTSVYGTPQELAEDLVDGRIDALWLGAHAPIPLFRELGQAGEAAILGLGSWEIARTVTANPRLSPAFLPAGVYPGQTRSLAALAAWNFVVAHKDLPDSRADAILRAVLQGGDPAKDIHPFAAETRAANAAQNRVIPFHPAAIRFYREIGIALR